MTVTVNYRGSGDYDPLPGIFFSGVEIIQIRKNSWAEQAGIKLDDEIHSINGTLFGPLKYEDRLCFCDEEQYL